MGNGLCLQGWVVRAKQAALKPDLIFRPPIVCTRVKRALTHDLVLQPGFIWQENKCYLLA